MLSAENETCGPGGVPMSRGVDQGVDSAAGAFQDFDTQSVSRKRKVAVMPGDSKNCIENREDLELESHDSLRLSAEIEILRSQLDEDVKELGYCEENEKLRVEMALKENEMRCLRKQNEELVAKYKGLHKNIVELLENQIDVKKRHLLEFKRLHSTMELNADIEGGKKMVHKACNEDETMDEKSCCDREASDEKSKNLDLEVAKLDAKIQSKMEKLNEMLEQEKFSEELGSVTVRKYIQTNMELQDARRELIAGVKDMKRRSKDIGITRLGAVSVKPFEDACRMKHGNDEPEIKAAMLAATWQYKVMDPSWRPFKAVEADGRTKEVLDEDNAELKQLLAEYGGDVCNAVKTALSEMNEHNPMERYAVPELWNFRERRKATVKEGIKYVFRKLREKRSRSKERTAAPRGSVGTVA